MLPAKTKTRIQTNKEAVKDLYKTTTKLRKSEDTREFFQDLMSSTEIKELARRLLCAKMLYDNQTYFSIEDLLGMSPVTINKIHTKTRGSKILRKIGSFQFPR